GYQRARAQAREVGWASVPARLAADLPRSHRPRLRANRSLVEALAARLLATEVVEEPELVRILGPKVTAETAAEEPAGAMGAWGESHA
ncbi:MAG: hypothetical protein ACXWLG_07355, partial [Myxococcaceae bacterium]